MCSRALEKKIIFKLLHMNERAGKDWESHLLYTSAAGFKGFIFCWNDQLIFRERECPSSSWKCASQCPSIFIVSIFSSFSV